MKPTKKLHTPLPKVMKTKLHLMLCVAFIGALCTTATPVSAATVSAALTSPTLVVKVFVSIDGSMIPVGVRDGIYASNLTIFSPATSIWVSESISMSDGSAFTVGDGSPATSDDLNFTIIRTGFANVGPVNNGGAIFPGTSPILTAWDSFGNPINLNGQPLIGATLNMLTSTNKLITPAGLDTNADVLQELFNARGLQGGIIYSNSALGQVNYSVVPEPSAFGMLTLGVVGLVGFRRSRNLGR